MQVQAINMESQKMGLDDFSRTWIRSQFFLVPMFHLGGAKWPGKGGKASNILVNKRSDAM